MAAEKPIQYSSVFKWNLKQPRFMTLYYIKLKTLSGNKSQDGQTDTRWTPKHQTERCVEPPHFIISFLL